MITIGIKAEVPEPRRMIPQKPHAGLRIHQLDGEMTKKKEKKKEMMISQTSHALSIDVITDGQLASSRKYSRRYI